MMWGASVCVVLVLVLVGCERLRSASSSLSEKREGSVAKGEARGGARWLRPLGGSRLSPGQLGRIWI